MNLLEVDLKKLVEILGTDLELGLSAEQVSRNRKEFGENVLFDKKNTAFGLLKKLFGDIMMVLFLLISLFDYLETGDLAGLVAALVVIIFYGAFVIGTHLFLEHFHRKTAKFSQSKYHVKRAGKILSISKNELVPGDILYLEKGDVVPCDGVVLRQGALKILEAGVTGRRIPVFKRNYNEIIENKFPYFECVLFAGSVILQGSVKLYVCNTGKNIFDVRNQTVSRQNTSLPQICINAMELKKQISLIWVLASLFLFAWGVFCGFKVFDVFYYISAMIVAAFPESMEQLCDLSLAYMSNNLFYEGIILRNPGSIDLLCDANSVFVYSSDYLFYSRPVVNSFYIGQEIYNFESNSDKAAPLLENLLLAQGDAEYFRGRRDEWNIERALQSAAASVKIQKPKLIKKYLTVGHYNFDPKLGYACSLVLHNNVYRLIVRGNPDAVFSVCTNVQMGDNIVPINETVRANLHSQARHLGGICERIIAVAVLNVTSPTTGDQRSLCRGMTFLGMFGFSTPVSASSSNAIRNCRKSGINTYLLTDDYPEAVTTLAKNASIICEEDYQFALPYATYDRLNRGVFIADIEKYKVLCNFPVEEKQNLLRYHKESGNISIAMTGGVLDSLPQMEADVSVVGVEEKLNAVRLNADLIIKEKSFDIIPKCINWARIFYRNIVHIMQYVLLLQFALGLSVFIGFTANHAEPFDKLAMILMGIFACVPAGMNMIHRVPGANLENHVSILMEERVLSLRAFIIVPFLGGTIQALSVMISRQVAFYFTENTITASFAAMITFVFSAFFASLSLKYDLPLFKVSRKVDTLTVVSLLCCIATVCVLTLTPIKTLWIGSAYVASLGFWLFAIALLCSLFPLFMLEAIKMLKKDDIA